VAWLPFGCHRAASALLSSFAEVLELSKGHDLRRTCGLESLPASMLDEGRRVVRHEDVSALAAVRFEDHRVTQLRVLTFRQIVATTRPRKASVADDRQDRFELDLGIVRDSTLNATNDFESFAETWEAAAYVGFESLAVTSIVCPNGESTIPNNSTSTLCAAS
jgi:hypothetical protein